jgi:hypothetical protein
MAHSNELNQPNSSSNNNNLIAQVVDAKFPTDAVALDEQRRVLSSGPKPRAYVDSNYAGITASGSVTSLSQSEDATFQLNAATQGAALWQKVGGNKQAFDNAVASDRFFIGVRNQLLNVVGASGAAEMMKAYTYNFYRGAEVMRNTPGGDFQDAKRNILFKANQGGYFRTMGNQTSTNDTLSFVRRSLPISVDTARKGLRAENTIREETRANMALRNDNNQNPQIGI